MRLKPYAHQAAEYENRVVPARALLWQQRTGKTKSVIDCACFLASAMEICGVLVIAPNGVHVNWSVKEIPRHAWFGMKHLQHAWRFSDPENESEAAEFMKLVGAADLSWLMVNMESLIRPEVRSVINKFFRRCDNRVMTVFDESHHFARPGSKRTSWARAIARRSAYRRILTGTSVENSPLQAFSQYELLERAALGHETYKSFKDEHVIYAQRNAGGGRTYLAVDRYTNIDEMKLRMAPFTSVVLRSDCEDLPDVQRDVRYVDSHPLQAKAYRAIKKKIIEELDEMGFIKPLYGGAAFVKLQQIEGGFLKLPTGAMSVIVPAAKNPKMLVLLDEIESYDGQVIIWFQYTHEIRAAAAMLSEAKIGAAEFHGGVGQKAREIVLRDFERGKTKVLLAQPKAAGEGYDISSAGKIVWFSQTPDAIVRAQANERATSIGGDHIQQIDIIIPGGVDEHYLKLTTDKTVRADDISRIGMREILNEINI